MVIAGVEFTVTFMIVVLEQGTGSDAVSKYAWLPRGILVTPKLTLELLGPEYTGAPIVPGPVNVNV